MSAPLYTFIEIAGESFIAYPDGRIYGGENCTLSVCPVESSVYGYRPTLPGSAALIALYGLCAIIQVILGIRYKTWGFMTAMLLGCVDEMFGYAGRIMMHDNPWGETGFIMQIVLITFGPVFFCAAIYVMIYKIIHYISPSHSRVPPRAIYWFFISCDIISLILQAVGGAMSSTSQGRSIAGVNIALAGLIFQVITLTAFCAVVADYTWRTRTIWGKYTLHKNFKIFVGFLSAATLFIFIRCCYRVYELSEGYSKESEALRDEPLFIGLEMVMVVVAAWCLVAAHPGRVLYTKHETVETMGPAERERLSAQEKTRQALGGNGSDTQSEV